MRAILVSLCLAAVPALARADLSLSLDLDAPRGPSISILADAAAPAAPARLLPSLAVDASLPLVALDDGGGAGMHRSERAVLALILGIIPGFGIGHVVADSRAWPIWLIVDIVLFFAVGALILGPGYGLLGLVILAERILEGIDAYNQALGRHFISGIAPPPRGSLIADAAGTPEALVPLARF